MRLVDADVLKLLLPENVHPILDTAPTAYVGIYDSDVGHFDGCRRGAAYACIDDPDRTEGLIVLKNELGATSKLLKSKFRL